MKHIDLFSGIGGFALAVDTVWPKSEHIFCDYDKFCQQVLRKHWPKSKIYEDIKTFADTRSEEQRGLPKGSWESLPEAWSSCDIITGGFPCQPFSAAGKRLGTADDRHLWPEMFRIIRTFKPTWVIAENVRGLATWNEGMILEQVCADLESQGYEVQPLIIPAVALNAPHRRDRIWFIAYRAGERSDNGERNGEERQILQNQHRHAKENKPKGNGRERGLKQIDDVVENAGHGNDPRFAKHGESERSVFSSQNASELKRPDSNAGKGSDSNSQSTRGQRRERRERREQTQRKEGLFGRDAWGKNWLEVATELCQLDDGVSSQLVRLSDGAKISYPKWRQESLKALGNSIVPQVAMEIMKAIKLTQNQNV